MAIIVEEAKSKEDYAKAWIKGMRHLHWFKERRLFDYNRNEEMEELSRNFGKPGHVFLRATQEGTDEDIGVLGIKLQGDVGVLRRWEPAVLLKERSSGAGKALIEKGSEWILQKKAQKAVCMLKYPYNLPETADWHLVSTRSAISNKRDLFSCNCWQT